MVTFSEQSKQNNTLMTQFSWYIGEVVYGGIDGIITTFAVVAWFVGAGSSAALGDIGPLVVVLFGLANLFGDGVSMGLWKYLSTKSEQDIYHREWEQEKIAIQSSYEKKYQETLKTLLTQGVIESEAVQIIDIMVKHPEVRIKRQMDNQLWIPDVRDQKPIIEGIITLFSFVVFGSVPLIPYIFLGQDHNYWIISVVMTGLSLALLWVVRRYVTRIDFFATVAQMVILWAVAAGVAYWTGNIVMKLQ